MDRAVAFHRPVSNCRVDRDDGETTFGVIEHHDGNGGCLVEGKDEIVAGGVLIYLNVNGRIRGAVGEVVPHGGSIIHDVHSIGQYGFRAVGLDSEGNHIALHSKYDA